MKKNTKNLFITSLGLIVGLGFCSPFLLNSSFRFVTSHKQSSYLVGESKETMLSVNINGPRDLSAQDAYNKFVESDKTINRDAFSEFVILKNLPTNAVLTAKNEVIDNKNGSLIIFVQTGSWYDDAGDLQNGEKSFKIVLAGFKNIKFTQIISRNGPFEITAKNALANLKGGVGGVIDIDKLNIYAHILSLPQNATIKLLNTSKADNVSGSLSLKVEVSMWYDYDYLNSNAKQFDVELFNFNNHMNTNLKSKDIKFNISATDALNTFYKNADPTGLITNQNELKKYLEITDLPDDTNITVKTETLAAAKNSSGVINISLSIDKYYLNSQITNESKTFDNLKLGKFAVDTIIKKRQTNFATTAIEAFDTIVEPNQKINLTNLRLYVDIIDAPDGADFTLLNHTLDNSKGTMTLLLNVKNYFKDGILENVDEKFTVTIDGFESVGLPWWIYLFAVSGGLVLIGLITIVSIIISKRINFMKNVSETMIDLKNKRKLSSTK